MAITINDLTDAAYRKLGIKNPTTVQDDDALEALNNMLSSWGPAFLKPYDTEEYLALTIGKAEYTIGTDGDLDTVRPMALLDVFLRNADGYDFPIKDIVSAQEYNEIVVKTRDGRPSKVCFLPEFPLAKIRFNREIDVAYTAYFTFRVNFAEYAIKTATYDLPPEYKQAIVYNLAIILAEDETVELAQSTYVIAGNTLRDIKGLNAANKRPPKAKFDFVEGSGPSDIVTGE